MAAKAKSEKKTSYVEKHVELKINLNKLYSTIGMGCTLGENIEWSTEEDREAQSDAITARMNETLKRDLTAFLDEHGLADVAAITLDSCGKVEVSDAELDEDFEAAVDASETGDKSTNDGISDDDDLDDDDWFDE
jgi:hypothetical protein